MHLFLKAFIEGKTQKILLKKAWKLLPNLQKQFFVWKDVSKMIIALLWIQKGVTWEICSSKYVTAWENCGSKYVTAWESLSSKNVTAWESCGSKCGTAWESCGSKWANAW